MPCCEARKPLPSGGGVVTTYKAEDHGCPVFAIDPRNTSRTCPKCGHIHKRNRPQQSIFRCLDCGYELNADLVAARNIAAKYHAEAGKSGLGGHPVNMPIVGEIEPPGTPLLTSRHLQATVVDAL
jgi:transposase